jgi:hypothetical protein
MVRCSANGNGWCEAEGKTWCACVYVPSEGLCLCKNDVSGILKKRNLSKARKKRIAVDTKVTLIAHKAPLFDVVLLLDRLFPSYQLAIPVAKAKKKVNVHIVASGRDRLLIELGERLRVPLPKL